MATVEVEKLMEGMVFADAAQKAAMEAILGNPANLETASRRYMRREEGTRLTQAKDAAEREAAAAKAAVEEEKRISVSHLAAIDEWQKEEQAKYQQEAKDAVESFKTQLKAKGIDPDSLLGQQMQQQQQQIQQPPAYDKSAMSKDFIDRGTAQVLATTAIDLPLEMARIQAEYRQLFGDVPADWGAVGDKAKANIISGKYQTVRDAVNATAEEAWKVSEVRETKKTEALRAQIEGEYKSKYEELLAKANLPGMNAPAYVDPNDKVFSKEFSDNTKVNDGGNADDPNFAAAKDDFLRVNAELEAAGVSMMK